MRSLDNRIVYCFGDICLQRETIVGCFFRKKKRYIEAILSYLNDKHELINDINILIETKKIVPQTQKILMMSK